MAPRERNAYALRLAVVVAAYYGAAKLGLELAFETASVTAVWPPTGIALAAVVLWGYRIWPGVFLGALLANSWTGLEPYTTFGIAVGNTLEAVAGAYLLQRFAGFRPSLERVRDVIALVLLAGIVSTAIAATIGATSLLLGDEIDAAAWDTTWRTWWLGDMGGDLLVAPALMVAATQWPFRRGPGRPLEALAIAAATCALTAFVFTNDISFTYLLFPPLIWAALRFWQPGATVASLLIAAIAIPLTEDDLGPFMGNSPDERLLLAQTFVGVLGISGLILAAVLTERRRVEDTVEYIADTLQESLLPSRLPELPGIETAVAFRPAGERHLVGGDFYDVFETGGGSWAIVVGDVCGKGADAAAATGLARYTLRAAAVNERRPSRVLATLNDAILRQRPAGEFCTVSYVRLEPGRGGSARVIASSGGHPLPLVVRADGGVQPLGRYGTLLGVVEAPELAEDSTELGPGDALVLYTDGLTDAYAPERLVTSDDLAAILARFAGRAPAEISAAIETAVLDAGDGEPRDDIALLVLRLSPRVDAVEEEVTLRLLPAPDAVSTARAAIVEVGAALDPDLLATVRLLVSELVTNSIRHAAVPEGAAIELRAAVFADRVRIEVSDEGHGFDTSLGAPDPESASGWGLYLVNRLADRWGAASEDGTFVWFELDR